MIPQGGFHPRHVSKHVGIVLARLHTSTGLGPQQVYLFGIGKNIWEVLLDSLQVSKQIPFNPRQHPLVLGLLNGLDLLPQVIVDFLLLGELLFVVLTHTLEPLFAVLMKLLDVLAKLVIGLEIEEMGVTARPLLEISPSDGVWILQD